MRGMAQYPTVDGAWPSIPPLMEHGPVTYGERRHDPVTHGERRHGPVEALMEAWPSRDTDGGVPHSGNTTPCTTPPWYTHPVHSTVRHRTVGHSGAVRVS